MVKITGFSVYQVDLPLHEGEYKFAGGASVAVFDTTVVVIDTDVGIRGYGEVCPLGPVYLPSYAAGVRAGLKEILPALLGKDPTAIGVINQLMDGLLKGHPYVKSPVDMACWDIMGKVAGLPVYALLGGSYGNKIELYRAISQLPPAKMAENTKGYLLQGYRNFQLKVGSNAADDIERIRLCRAALPSSSRLVADANTGWLPHDAKRVVNGVKDLDVYIEQPCPTYEQCLTVRQHSQLPFMLDENIDGLAIILRASGDRAMDGANIKISKFGGLWKARQARDLCVELGYVLTLEDTWGGDIVTAAISHLAASTPLQNRLMSTDFNSYVTVSIADGAPQRDASGCMTASEAPGLGVEPKWDVLGKAVFEVRL